MHASRVRLFLTLSGGMLFQVLVQVAMGDSSAKSSSYHHINWYVFSCQGVIRGRLIPVGQRTYPNDSAS
jgi:hypothetical protein